MTIALGLIFTVLLAAALWLAADEGPEAVPVLAQVNPDQADDNAAWDLIGWYSFG